MRRFAFCLPLFLSPLFGQDTPITLKVDATDAPPKSAH
jgi:hypothetical protein